MLKLKNLFIVFIFFIFIIYNTCAICYGASVKVTDENLKASLQKFISSDENNQNIQVTVENNQIKITSNDGNYIMNYDLTNKPTFIYEAEIKQGMSYKEFQEKTNTSMITMLGYMAVANIQGVNFEDSLAYFSMCLLSSAFSGESLNNMSNSYMIIDDTITSDGVTIERNNNDTKTIYASEFGNRVMEYVNAMYAEKQTFKDTEGINSFEMTIERKDVTNTSCKLVSTLTIDTDADFSKINGYVEQIGNSFSNFENNNENNNGNNNTNNSETMEEINNNNNNTINANPTATSIPSSSNLENSNTKTSEVKNENVVEKKDLPKTGNNDFALIGAILAFSIFAILLGIKNNSFKDVK